MAKYTDAKMVLTDAGYYDISIGDDGDIEKIDSFDTAILVSLFGSDRRASATEVPEPERRRGWIGDIYQPVEAGSKLWLLQQARLTVDTVNRAQDYAAQALQWLVDFGYLKAVVVRCSRDLSRSQISADISLVRFDDSVETRNYILWENTGRA